MKKRKLFLCLILCGLSLYMNGQNDVGYRLQLFPYNLFEWKEDVNSDFIVDTQDVLRIYESIQKSEVNNQKTDVNLDNVIDTQDVLKVYEYIQTESSPTLIAPDPAIDVIGNAIELLEYGYIVRYPVCLFSIIVPTDKGMLTYIDPVSMGQAETHIWKLMMNPQPGSNAFSRIQAVVYSAEKQEDGSWLQKDSIATFVGNSSTDQIFNRLRDILENCIVNELFEPTKHYYQTLSGNYVRVDGQSGSDLTISGGFQMDENHPSKVIKTADMLNGKAYVVDNAVYSSYNSVCDVLSANPEFSKFYELLQSCGVVTTTAGKKGLNWSSASKNGNLIYIPENSDESIYYLLNSYHYTMYVPTNDAMDEAYEKGLPTIEMLEEAMEFDADDSNEVLDSAAHLRKVMLDFVKYHIQENAVVIDNQYELNRYASMKLNKNYVPYKIQVEAYGNDLTVQGVCSDKQYVNKSKMYNKLVREYWLNNRSAWSATMIETSSSVVLHAIDHPLLYNYNKGADLTKSENNQFIYVPREVYFESNY